jgi:hypothetical protein
VTFDHKAHTKAWEAKAAADKKVARDLTNMAHEHLAALANSDWKADDPARPKRKPREFDVRIILYPHDPNEDED